MMGLIHPFTLVANTPRVGRKAKAATAGANLKNSKAIFQKACAVVAIIPKIAVADITAKGMALAKTIICMACFRWASTSPAAATVTNWPTGPATVFTVPLITELTTVRLVLLKFPSNRFKLAMEMRRVCFRGCMA